ncbi:hypothetical protein [Saccharicrinis fermentans]|uniref:Uncharacterized protein n=1 Tax=Saccharicrinis fermentans DSM 9555 = JCM 21142 TaxID=869213 RepID=W7XWW9_9BACT|nr:hypothetical protein [Saccharicrinis fermentans]GAF02890.1 hypothetical protein JCM21142_41539 [Saccharicrinis fermentans DSM 9555 = JCM 21142]
MGFVPYYIPQTNNLVALRANYHGDASNPVTVLEGIKKKLGPETEITYAQACPIAVRENRAIEPRFLYHIDHKGKKHPGLLGRFYNNKDLTGDAKYTRVDPIIEFLWWQQSPNSVLIKKDLLPKEH